MDLYDRHGARKYLTASEWLAFMRAAEAADQAVGTFCGVLAYSGCRISEALALTADRVDVEDGVVIFESLKKRQRGIYRAIPVPPAFLNKLVSVHDLDQVRRRDDRGREVHLWPWSRATAWRRVSEIMDTAGITGLHATPRGLRHGFGIRCASAGVPLNLAARWLGHSQLSTTAIYTNATGPEERRIAQRMWDQPCA